MINLSLHVYMLLAVIMILNVHTIRRSVKLDLEVHMRLGAVIFSRPTRTLGISRVPHEAIATSWHATIGLESRSFQASVGKGSILRARASYRFESIRC